MTAAPSGNGNSPVHMIDRRRTGHALDESITLREYIDSRLNEHERAQIALRNETERIAKSLREETERVAQSLMIDMDHRFENSKQMGETRWMAREALESAHAIAHARDHEQAEDALDKAEQSVNARLAQMNEFRAALNDQSTTMLRREIFDQFVISLTNRIDLGVSSNTERIELLRKDRESKTDQMYNSIDQRLKLLETASANLTGRLAAMGIGIALVMAVIGLAIRFLP